MFGCVAKFFQPPPPMFKSYTKENASEEQVKEALIQCGYPHIYGGDKDDTVNDVAQRENCMFRKGFKYRSGYKGICSLQGKQAIPACLSSKHEIIPDKLPSSRNGNE